MEIISGPNIYEVKELVAKSDRFRLYACTQKGVAGRRLLQIAATVEDNPLLQRSALHLKELEGKAYEIEEEFALVKEKPDDRLDYQLGIPELIDSFECLEQGRRVINILGFRNVEDISQVIPLANIAQKDKRRIDAKTSAWIMGKLLKLLVFAHGEGFTPETLDAGNILIEPVQHYVMIFNWARSDITPAKRREDISNAAKTVITAMGGNPRTGYLPDDGVENFAQYREILFRLASQEFTSAKNAHEAFYGVVYVIWPRKYHDFGVRPINQREEE
ncbi:MAG TPA: hypothetical protein P5080_00075 [Candidatus Paceibacterota bacterium]|nr:hypothetical protein [Candidatus Pacearchaeota archaeon]HRZ50370.1 hypothetical protein [Candidatus Paceibacterota bacterium]HSA36091.1 hypothetical protein [Candidatus Paceibacterota bacterium]